MTVCVHDGLFCVETHLSYQHLSWRQQNRGPRLPCDEVHIILATNVHNSECGEVVNPFGKLEVQSAVSASVVETAHPRARKKNVVNPVLRSLRRLPRGAALLAERGGG